MYLPADIWHYIVWLSLPKMPLWKRQYSKAVFELEESIASCHRPTILRMQHNIMCVARQIVVRGQHPLMAFRRTVLEHAYLNI